MTVNIDLIFDEDREPSTPHVMSGGIKITVDDARLFKYVNEEGQEWPRWAPEYLSGRISIDILRILETARDVLDGAVELYETASVRFGGTRNVVVVERLSKNRLRLAFHVLLPRDGERDGCPVAESERGYLVAAEEFGRAALAAGRQYQSRAENVGFGAEDISSVVETMEELETLLDQ